MTKGLMYQFEAINFVWCFFASFWCRYATFPGCHLGFAEPLRRIVSTNEIRLKLTVIFRVFVDVAVRFYVERFFSISN